MADSRTTCVYTSALVRYSVVNLAELAHQPTRFTICWHRGLRNQSTRSSGIHPQHRLRFTVGDARVASPVAHRAGSQSRAGHLPHDDHMTFDYETDEPSRWQRGDDTRAMGLGAGALAYTACNSILVDAMRSKTVVMPGTQGVEATPSIKYWAQ